MGIYAPKIFMVIYALIVTMHAEISPDSKDNEKHQGWRKIERNKQKHMKLEGKQVGEM